MDYREALHYFRRIQRDGQLEYIIETHSRDGVTLFDFETNDGTRRRITAERLIELMEQHQQQSESIVVATATGLEIVAP